MNSIVKKMADIQAEAAKDLVIDKGDPGGESLRTAQLHSKYLNYLMDAKIELVRMTSAFNKLRKAKWEYYSGRMSQEDLLARKWEPFQHKILKQDIDLYLDSDEELIAINTTISYQNELITYLDHTLKAVNNRQWNIRSYIDWTKFTNGIS